MFYISPQQPKYPFLSYWTSPVCIYTTMYSFHNLPRLPLFLFHSLTKMNFCFYVPKRASDCDLRSISTYAVSPYSLFCCFLYVSPITGLHPCNWYHPILISRNLYLSKRMNSCTIQKSILINRLKWKSPPFFEDLDTLLAYFVQSQEERHEQLLNRYV